MQLSGANGTDRELIITYGSEASNGNVFYGCLGLQQLSGATDTYSIEEDNSNKKHLYCATKASAGASTGTPEIIALDVQRLSASLATSPKKGVDINLIIEGMPGDMKSKGFTFSLAMRQRILIDAGVTSASARTDYLISN